MYIPRENRRRSYRHQCLDKDFGRSTDMVFRRPQRPHSKAAGKRWGRDAPRRTGTSRQSGQRRGLWWWGVVYRSKRRRVCWRGYRRLVTVRQPLHRSHPETTAVPSSSPRPGRWLRRQDPPRCCPPATVQNITKKVSSFF